MYGSQTDNRPMHRVRVFCSYAHEDSSERAQLAKHLAMLERNGLMEPWSDQYVLAGADWRAEIESHLATADLVLFLVSPDFLASSFCWDVEVPNALARHRRGDARVVPVIVRACQWQKTEFAAIQALPAGGEPIKGWQDQDAAWSNVANALSSLIMQLAEDLERRAAGSGFGLLRCSTPGTAPIPLRRGMKLLVGRQVDADILLPDDDRKASRQHCEIELTKRGVIVRDLGSKNSTFVNEEQITEVRLRGDDLLRCGRTQLRFIDSGATETDQEATP